MPEVFLSYSREDQVTARRFADALQREGFSVWWDQALDAGESFDKVTEQALKEAKAVVVLWSKHSVDSRWVRAEATQADRFGTLVPVTIEPCNRPIMFELTHTAELTQWNGEASDPRWRAYIDGLRRTVGKSSALPGVFPTAPASALALPKPGTVRALRTRARKTVTWGAVATLIALGAGLYWYLQVRNSGSSTTVASSSAVAPASLASIAVLPFRDMSQNRDQEYFADGVTEEILNTLAGLKDLKVTARTSAFAFKGKDVDLRTVGQTLGVQHILEGSIRKDGDTLRITAQLIDTKSDTHVWSKTYDRPLKDIFSVQEDIARSVAEALQVALGVGFGNQPGMTRDVEAYDAVLAAWPLQLRGNPETQRRAIGLYEQAIRRDPAFAVAWFYLASAYGEMANLVTEGAQAWQQKRDTAIENGRRLAPDAPELQFNLAERSINQGRWTEAAGHIENLASAISRSGEDPRGRFYMDVGRTRDAVAVWEQEKARDPLNPYVSFNLAVAYSSVRDFRAAIAEFKRGYPLDPSWQYYFQLSSLSNALATRDHAEIVRLMDAVIAGRPNPQASEAIVKFRSMLDHPADALTYFQGLVRNPSTPAFELTGTSQYLAYLGDTKTSLEALRLAFERGAGVLASVTTWYPVMSEVRKLPEFKQLVRDVGFVDYWKKYGWGDFCKPVGTDDFECTQ